MKRSRVNPTFLAAAMFCAALLALAGFAVAPDSSQASFAEKAAKAKPVHDGKWEHRVSAKNKKWARRVAVCESGMNPNALGAGGKYRGAFQFLRSTWQTSPQSPGGDPVAFSYKTQAYVAVRLKMRSGSSPWPSCG